MSPSRLAWSLAALTPLVFSCTPTASAQIPPGYYNGVDTSNQTVLRQTLHVVIDDHTRFPYTSGGTDTWDILESAMEHPTDPSRILDLYKNEDYVKQGGGNVFYDREHSWPSSYGFPNDGSGNYPYTDCHLLFLCDGSYNGARSNKPFRNCNAACNEYPTEVNAGMGGPGGGYPGNSNWGSGQFTSGTWETWMGRRGDVARAILYADIRYEGGNHGGTGHVEPNLVVTDVEALISASNTGSNEAVAYMGMLQALLLWHVQDPVDAKEQLKNDTIYAFQGNRNPFIDHPEWVDCLFTGNCGGGNITPPSPPVGLGATGGDGVVTLGWSDNAEPDLSGYNVYRSAGGPFVQQNGALVVTSDYTDNSVNNGTAYTYEVTAVDTSGNESGASGQASATPQSGVPTATPWINEFHYDNVSNDTGEFLEIAGKAGTDLSNWSVIGYNGNGGFSYKTVALSGTLPDQQAGFGTLAFDFASMQNGAPDGLVLVDDQGTVIQFASYEGTMTAADGPAQGLQSTNVGVAESSSTPIGFSLQLTGTGSQAIDFTWATPSAETPGLPNTGQTFSGCQADLGYGNHATAVLSACGVGLATGETVTLSLDGLPAAATPFLVAGLAANPTTVFDIDNATLVPIPILIFLPMPNPGTGTLAFPVPGGNGPLSVYVQYILNETSGYTTTNTIRLDLEP